MPLIKRSLEMATTELTQLTTEKPDNDLPTSTATITLDTELISASEERIDLTTSPLVGSSTGKPVNHNTFEIIPTIFDSARHEPAIIADELTITTEITTEIPSLSNGKNTTEASSTTESSIESIANTTDLAISEATTVFDVMHYLDATRTGRSLTAESFPHFLKVILQNDPVINIKKYKLDINHFADKLCNHQQHFGLSENLFESLHKIGNAFAVFYDYSPNKQLSRQQWQFITDLKNINSSVNNCIQEASSSNPLASSTLLSILNDTTFSTTDSPTTQLSTALPSLPTPEFTPQSIPTTTLNSTSEEIFPVTNISSTEFTPQINPTTTANVTLDEIFPVNNPTTKPVDIDPVITATPLDNNLLSLGLLSMGNGLVAGFIDGVAKNIPWNNPVVRVAAQVVSATALATLPVMLSTVDNNESEQSDTLTKVLQATAYSLGSSLVLNGVNYAARSAYAYLNKQPLNKDSIGSKALEALPLFANTSLLVTDGYNLSQAVVIVGANTLSAGISRTVTQTGIHYFFNSTKKNNTTDAELGENNNNFVLDEIGIDKQFPSILSQVCQNNTEAIQVFFTQLDVHFKEQESAGKPIDLNEFYLKNLKQLNIEDPLKAEWAYNYLISEKRLVPLSNNLQICSVIPFSIQKIENWNELSLMEKHNKAYKNEIVFPNTPALQLQRLIASFLYGFKLQTKKFQITYTAIKNLKLLSGELAPSIDMLSISKLGSNPLCIFQPIQITGKLAKPFLIYEIIESLIKAEKNNNSSQSSLLRLFPICSETSTALIEISKQNLPKLQNKIVIHDPIGLLNKDSIRIANIAKKYNYSFKKNPDKNYRVSSTPLDAYYFIKNYVKNYSENQLQNDMIPDNVNASLLVGLTSSMLSGITQNKKIRFNNNTLQFNEVSSLKSQIKNKETNDKEKNPSPEEMQLTLEKLKQKTLIAINKIEQNKEKSITYLSSNAQINSDISIFTATAFNERGDAHLLSTVETIDYLLRSRQSDIETHINSSQVFKDLLPLHDEKGIAIIEILTSKNTPKQILIHDPNQVLKNVFELIAAKAENYGYSFKYNPDKVYSSHWTAKETSQLGAYFFIKDYFHKFFELPSIAIPPKLENYFEIRQIILNELKINLYLEDETKLNSIQKINIYDKHEFNLKNYIDQINDTYQFPESKLFLSVSHETEIYKIILDEIKHNLYLNQDCGISFEDSKLQITPSEKVINLEWPMLFGKKSSSECKKNNDNQVLFEATQPQQITEADIVRFLLSFHSELLIFKMEKDLKEFQEKEENKRRGKRLSLLFENSENLYELVDKFLLSEKTIILDNLVDLFLKLKHSAKDQQEIKVFDKYHNLLLKTFPSVINLLKSDSEEIENNVVRIKIS